MIEVIIGLIMGYLSLCVFVVMLCLCIFSICCIMHQEDNQHSEEINEDNQPREKINDKWYKHLALISGSIAVGIFFYWIRNWLIIKLFSNNTYIDIDMGIFLAGIALIILSIDYSIALYNDLSTIPYLALVFVLTCVCVSKIPFATLAISFLIGAFVYSIIKKKSISLTPLEMILLKSMLIISVIFAIFQIIGVVISIIIIFIIICAITSVTFISVKIQVYLIRRNPPKNDMPNCLVPNKPLGLLPEKTGK